ncbi:hypothetical protein CDD82_7613 [Ophiocordyceps australis]|uniref:AB hydrolase-1 domain-containing protein n=1 Tax=Ophiocordyceps australis TaxID=1399860 RepID=A0A2C5YPM4_9HYPO|nr:hypothetical protein CDD82_7613 [Ophiocordyceps australis]
MSAVYDILEHTIQASHIREYARATAQSQDEPLLLHVKQYVPKDNAQPTRGDLTIVGAHANGFPKELYEPLWDDLHAQCLKLKMGIRAIWIFDAAWQGRSGILNHGKLGDDPCWNDVARDMIHLINTFRMPRPIVAIGHSFGGNSLVNLSLLHPRLLETIILIDPVIGPYTLSPESLAHQPIGFSIRRRVRWPSRAAAAQSMRSKPFYQAWDPRALDKWLQYGLCSVAQHHDESQDAAQQVTLTTTRDQEVFTYFRPSWPAFDPSGSKILHPHLVPDVSHSPESQAALFPVYRPESINTMDRLPHVRSSLLYITGGLSFTALPMFSGSDDSLSDSWLHTTGIGTGGSGGAPLGRVRKITHPDHGHLIPFEIPSYCALHAASWIRCQLDRWWKDEAQFDHWARKPLAEKTTVSDEYKRRIGLTSQQTAKDKAML